MGFLWFFLGVIVGLLAGAKYKEKVMLAEQQAEAEAKLLFEVAKKRVQRKAKSTDSPPSN